MSSVSDAQFDKASFELTFGISQPYDELHADDYININQDGYIYVDSNLFANNLGAVTGIQFSGSAKINFDKYSITRALITLGYTSFNTFQATRTGTTLLKFVNNTYEQRQVTYDYGFNDFSIGLGLEIAPTSFTNIVTPFFNANFNFNFFNAELTRTTSIYDSNNAKLNSFRMGVNFNTGIEAMINKNIGVVAGLKYDLGNLLLEDTQRDGFIEWGSQNASINDANGRYISNLYYPIGEAYNYFQSSEKKINWGTAYIGVTFYPFSDSKKTAKPKSQTPKNNLKNIQRY